MGMERRVICILGMHRSGTSVAARLLNLLGVDLGPEALIARPAPDNPRGFWEHPAFKTIDDELLARLGGRWDAPPPFAAGWHASPALDDQRADARRAIDLFAAAPLWGWKSPRACLTLPFWTPLLTPAPVSYVIATRNVLDVARSLRARDGLSLTAGAELWLTYMAGIMRHTAGRPRLFVSYDTIIDDPAATALRLATFVGRLDALRDPVVERAIGRTVETGLRRHHATVADVFGHPELPFAAKAASLGFEASFDDDAAGMAGTAQDAILGEAVAAGRTAHETARALAIGDVERAGLRARIASLDTTLAAATSGAGWRLLSRYRALIDRLLPRDSSRRRVYAAAVRRLRP
jgi:hypothetical protein